MTATATAIARRTDGDGGSVASLAESLRGLSEAAVSYATAKASHQIDDWTDKLNDFASSGGATERAGFEALKAWLAGKNPVWGAIKGGWLGASGGLRVVVVVSLILLLVTAPVLLLLLLLGLLVAAAVAGVRAAAR